MTRLVIIHITPALSFKLSIHICFHADDCNIFRIRQEFVYSRSAPFRITRRGCDAFFIKHIHNLAQTGTSKIVLKYTADSIRLFFMYKDFLNN